MNNTCDGVTIGVLQRGIFSKNDGISACILLDLFSLGRGVSAMHEYINL